MKMNHEISAAHVAFTGRVLMVAALIVFSAVTLNAISTRNAEYQAKMKELVDNPQKKLITTVNGCAGYRDWETAYGIVTGKQHMVS